DQRLESDKKLKRITLALGAPGKKMAEFWVEPTPSIGVWKARWALTEAERLRLRCLSDVLIADRYGLGSDDVRHILQDSDRPLPITLGNNPKGFWRVDKDKDPELRHTVLTLIAFHDLEEKVRACGGNSEEGINLFLNQNDGEGWLLPETLCLADYGLGHDERAKRPQPVASRLGPRFFDWQLAQSPEESWRECHLHARNLLGEMGYQQLLNDIKSPGEAKKSLKGPEQPSTADLGRGKQGELFD
ncbi:MAG: hypothetical protein RBR16_12570, partial [Syntrophus sp. (in: bacteria)]|nr:hypothetical protein [Syntrophus sp. (in: bacteria)]